MSPYDLEASHTSSIDEKFDRLMERVDEDRERLENTIEMATFEPCWILKTLPQMYGLDEQVLRVFENIKKHWFDMAGSDSLAALLEGGGDSVGETATALACRDAARTAREIIGLLTKSQLQWCVTVVCKSLVGPWVQHALARIRRGHDVLEVMSYTDDPVYYDDRGREIIPRETWVEFYEGLQLYQPGVPVEEQDNLSLFKVN